MAAPAAYADLRNQYRGHRGHLTTRCALATAYVDTNQDLAPGPDLTIAARIRTHLARLTESYDHCERLCEDIMGLAYVYDHETRLQDWRQRVQAFRDLALPVEAALQALLQRTTTPVVAPAAAAPPAPAPGAPATKANIALRPFTLTASHSIPELFTWIDLFRAYYTSSRMNLSQIPEQQAYFKVCLESSLWTRIKHLLTPHTPIFGDADSCEALLRHEFNLIYPLFSRRLDFLRSPQASGENWMTWLDGLMDKRNCAELDTLSAAELMVFTVINSTTDSKLRERFLRLTDPTLEDLRTCAQQHLQAQSINKELDSSSKPAVCSVQPSPPRQSQQQLQQQQQQQRFPPRPRPSCLGCFTKHDRNKCPHRQSTCHHCQKQGHIAPVCLQKASGKPPVSKPTVNVVSEVPSEVSGDDPTPPPGKSLPHINLLIAPNSGSTNHLTSCLPDTGTYHTVMSRSCALRNHLRILPLSQELSQAGGSPLPLSGFSVAFLSFGTRSITTSVFVAQNLVEDCLLGYKDLLALGWTFPPNPPPVCTLTSDSLDQIKRDFADVFSDVLKQQMSGPPAHIVLKDGPIRPTRTLTARPIPIHWTEQADKVIKDALDAGIIVRVPDTEPTDWISPAFFVPKEGGKAGVRLVTDYTNLNKHVQRPVHTFPSAHDIVSSLPPDAKFFCKLDCTSGYFQVKLDLESSLLTTFLLPSGRYRYVGSPMGLNASSDFWCHRSDLALLDLPWLRKIVDDILIWAPDLDSLFQRIRIVLNRCRQHGITISLRKIKYGSSLPFAGFLVSSDGVRPDPSLLEAIANFPTPTDTTSLRSFLGFANQLGTFLPDLSHILTPLYSLLQKNVAFVWLPDHDRTFLQAKHLLASPPTLRQFSPSSPTELYTDASRLHGFGFALFQIVNNERRLIQCGSCTTTPAQRNYSTIELESKAIAWAINKCSFFLKGHPGFHVITDHRPLQGIYSKPLSEIENPRLLSNREHLSGYSFTVTWQPGKLNIVADALSRAPLFDPPEDLSSADAVCFLSPTDDPLLLPLARDPTVIAIADALHNNVHVKNLPPNHPGHALSSIWDRLSTVDGLLVLDSYRLYVPLPERPRILGLLHQGHQGITKTYQLARQLYFWPGMKADISSLISKCEGCVSLLPSQPHPPFSSSMSPTQPLSDVGVDLFQLSGRHYLCMVDSFSGYPFIHALSSLSTNSVTKKLTEWFLLFGFPERLRSDGGPQFRSEFSSWCLKYGIEHQLSSPYHPQSNGLAESAVKSMKKLLQASSVTSSDFQAALSAFKATPRENGLSPNFLFFGRNLRSLLPTLSLSPQTHTPLSGLRERSLAYANRTTKPSPLLSPGSSVLVQNPKTHKWDSSAVVTSKRPSDSYFVSSDSGSFLRHSKFLKKQN